MNRIIIIITITLFALQQLQAQKPKYKTKYVVVIVIDGPRYSETWGDSSHSLIPKMVKMSREGVIFTNFRNDRYTYTSSGHTQLTTGHAQVLENVKGTQLPDFPSYMQYYLQKTGKDSTATFLITSKDKLAILGNCYDSSYHNQYMPATNCGNAGWGTGYRQDSITCRIVLATLDQQNPDLVLVNFREPDWSGHRCDWEGYLKGIRDTDSLAYELFKFINSNKHYRGKTSFFITNDHGRHLEGVKEGFCEHDDDCEGCQHINLFAFGPDFKKGIIETGYYNQMDLTATIAELLQIQMPHCKGKVIKVLFK